MRLNSDQERRALNLYKFIKAISQKDPEYFERTGIAPCKSCNGTGLAGLWKSSDESDYGWDSGEYCRKCSGIGYTGIADDGQVDLLYYICKNCDGRGCIKCENNGIVDWVSHIMGR